MRMLCTFINEKFLCHSTAQTVLWQHAFYCALYHQVRTTGNQVLGRFYLLATWVQRICLILLIFQFVAGKYYTGRVYYNYIITAVEVRRIICLVLTTQN